MSDLKVAGFQKMGEAIGYAAAAEGLNTKTKDGKLKPSNCNNIWQHEHTKNTTSSAKPCEVLVDNPANLAIDAGTSKDVALVANIAVDGIKNTHSAIKTAEKQLAIEKAGEALIFGASAYGSVNANSVEKAKSEPCDAIIGNPADLKVLPQ